MINTPDSCACTVGPLLQVGEQVEAAGGRAGGVEIRLATLLMSWMGSSVGLLFICHRLQFSS